MQNTCRRLSIWLTCCLLLSVSAQAAATSLDGPLIQGGLIIGTTTPGASVWQDDQPVRVSSEGKFLLGFDRDMPATSRLKIRQADGQIEQRILPIQQRQYAIQRIQLPNHKVAPMTPEAIRHTRRDRRLLIQARRRNDDRQDFIAGFIWPVTGPISGVYGSQRILNGQKKRPHYGVDVARPTGTPVVAPAAGIITVAEPDMFYSGGTLIIDHGHQLTSALLHLSELSVRVGDRVQQGQLIGRVGASGRATGPHLDWRIKLRQHQVDPQLLVPPMTGVTK